GESSFSAASDHVTAPAQSRHRACTIATSCATSWSFGLSFRYFLKYSSACSRSPSLAYSRAMPKSAPLFFGSFCSALWYAWRARSMSWSRLDGGGSANADSAHVSANATFVSGANPDPGAFFGAGASRGIPATPWPGAGGGPLPQLGLP